MSASRRVTTAVNDVLDLAPPRRGEISLTRLVAAVSADRGRPIEVTMADLRPGCAVSGANTPITTCS